MVRQKILVLFRRVSRRTFVSLILGIVTMSPKQSWGRNLPEMLYLKEAVRIPLKSVTQEWQQQYFEAWVTRDEIVAKGVSDKRSFDRLFFGALLRLPGKGLKTGSGPDDFFAYCTLCSHEACEVILVEDTRPVRLEEGIHPEHPLVVCPCHFSVFDPQEHGRVLNGPALRGLYRFKFHQDRDHIVITHIESAAMALFQS